MFKVFLRSLQASFDDKRSSCQSTPVDVGPNVRLSLTRAQYRYVNVDVHNFGQANMNGFCVLCIVATARIHEAQADELVGARSVDADLRAGARRAHRG